MDWTKVPAGVINAAQQRFWTEVGEDADAVAARINSEPEFLKRLAERARDTSALVVPVVISGAPVASIEKFALLYDLGEIVVPANYVHGTRLTAFKAKHQGGRKKAFCHYNEAITDDNFGKSSRILKPGDKLRVRAFHQTVPGTTTSEERMTYLATQGAAVYVGAQGASLTWEQKHDQLPKGKWYSSFDEKERLWEGAGGNRRVPYVGAFSLGDWRFNLGSFERVWNGDDAFFGFSDVESSGT